jgi:hypothetical protein
MDRDGEDRTGQMPLPGFGEPGQASGRVPLPDFVGPAPSDPPAPARTDGVRRVRHLSNWTLAALIAGTGAATVALAHNAFPSVTTAAGTSAATGTAAAATPGATGPQVTHSVATTSGSGVVTTTTTGTASGKVIVTHVRHTATYHDN